MTHQQSRQLAARFGRTLVHAALALAIPAAGVALATSASAVAPEPDPVPRRWQLTIEPGPLRVTTITVDGVPQVYLYFTYKVINNSGEDLLFTPAFDLANDEGDILRSGRDVPPGVTKRIIDSLDNPLLHDQIDMIDHLLQGPENAREGVVIWPAVDLDTDEVTLYAAGFSGETKTIAIPDTDKMVTLRKVFMIRYETGGTLEGRGSKPLDEVERRWIMR